MSALTRPDVNVHEEMRLFDQVERIGKRRAGRKAVHIHLSKLAPFYRARVAADIVERLVAHHDGELFKLANQDLFYLFRSPNPIETEETAVRLGYLFNDDPLSDADGPALASAYFSWYDVERQYDIMRSVVQVLCDDAHRRLKRLREAGLATDIAAPLDPQRLVALIDAIAPADLSNLLRRQTIYAVLSDQRPRPVIDEIYISIAGLREQVLPDCDIAGDRWLFQHVTETLDRRVLQILLRDGDGGGTQAFSLNLNVSTVLSPQFSAFDASLRAALRGNVVIEMQPIDVFADLSAFAFARDFLHDRGYRICLDGLDEFRLSLLDHAALKIDLFKLAWSDALAGIRPPARDEQLRHLVERIDRSRLILNRVDTEDAVAFGQSVGIVMFQGRHIDRIAPPRPIVPRAR